MVDIEGKEGIGDEPSISPRILANPSTARWEVNINPPYRLPGPGSNPPDVKRSRTETRASVWKWCSRTGMYSGLKFLEEKRVAYLSSGEDFVFRRRMVGFVG